ncbi:DUF3795 domain-containing protein [Candidatus Bipolaricaulota bacterium]|nr:DUF3795 domain-containing protein [Candidatus Bipolaricaulota bacterium]
MEKMIATCGLTCTECAAYIATKSGDAAALEALAKTWSKEYEAELTPEDCACAGCHSTVGPWMTHCAECEYRACGTEKGVETCAECSEYACDKLVKFFEFVPVAKTTLDGLRGEL